MTETNLMLRQYEPYRPLSRGWSSAPHEA